MLHHGIHLLLDFYCVLTQVNVTIFCKLELNSHHTHHNELIFILYIMHLVMQVTLDLFLCADSSKFYYFVGWDFYLCIRITIAIIIWIWASWLGFTLTWSLCTDGSKYFLTSICIISHIKVIIDIFLLVCYFCTLPA